MCISWSKIWSLLCRVITIQNYRALLYSELAALALKIKWLISAHFFEKMST